mmetsp:Transcript_9592/g.23901  ORF Transcript_9592/g.23901 Transcript_9592/m.23901 type:complete len:219 (+) Transcript_9592:322-978(+)
MAKITTKILYSKFNFLSRRRQFQQLLVENEDVEDIDDFRTRGSEILKAITTKSEFIATKPPSITAYNKKNSTCVRNSCSSGTELQKTGQEVTNSPQHEKEVLVDDFKQNTVLSGNERQNKVKRLKYLKRTIELARRKRFDNQGSFAANMVTYRDGKNKTCPNMNEKGNGKKRNNTNSGTGTSIRSSGHDDRSRSSESTCVTNDVTLQVIDEEVTYYNT